VAGSVAEGDGGACDPGALVVVVVVEGEASTDDSVGSSDGSGALPGRRDAISAGSTVLWGSTGAGGLR
jgi:hypothetical protein